MQLEDKLRICLFAVESRYPDHVVDLNEEILGSQELGAQGWSSLDVIAHLEQTAPYLLDVTAHLVVDVQKSEIYLLGYSRKLPALLIHCRGKLPSRQQKMISRQLAPA